MRESEVLEWIRDVGAVGTPIFFQVIGMYEIGRKPKKSEAFARVICQICRQGKRAFDRKPFRVGA